MFSTVFVIIGAFILLAVIFWGRGMVGVFRRQEKARNTLSTGFMIGVLGLVIAAILFVAFNI